MIATYGPRADLYAAALGDIEAIVVEPALLVHGHLEAIRRRSLGESFYGMLLIEEHRDRTMSALAPAVLEQTKDSDRQRVLLSSVEAGSVLLNGKPGHELLAEPDLSDPLVQLAATEFLALCPAVLVRSLAEYDRISTWTPRTRPYELVLIEPSVPVVERRAGARPGVVIWAPERDSLFVSLHAFALAEIHADVTVVSHDGGVVPGLAVTTYRIGDPRVDDALAGANCVVLTDATDPGAAVAFARQGYGIVAPVSSGAHEFVRDVSVYDPAALRQLYVAVTMSLGQPSSPRELPAMPPRVPARPELPVTAAEAPPATIVVPTFNRRADLERCLQYIAAQTYPNTRAVIVNDAGEAVDDIVARFPFARLVNLEENGGPARAFMAGVRTVTDGFVQVFSDDDVLFPDHLDRLVTAMLRSGAAVAHSNILMRFLEPLDDGSSLTTGYNATIFVGTVTPSEAPVAGHALLWRRSVFEEIGGWLEDSVLADQEIQMRAAQHYAFAYVDQITAEWRIHGTNFSGKTDSGAEQRRIYEELHPVPGRPLIASQREKVLASIAARPAGYVFLPTVSLVRTNPA